jgi:hypothetical protein
MCASWAFFLNSISFARSKKEELDAGTTANIDGVVTGGSGCRSMWFVRGVEQKDYETPGELLPVLATTRCVLG